MNEDGLREVMNVDGNEQFLHSKADRSKVILPVLLKEEQLLQRKSAATILNDVV